MKHAEPMAGQLFTVDLNEISNFRGKISLKIYVNYVTDHSKNMHLFKKNNLSKNFSFYYLEKHQNLRFHLKWILNIDPEKESRYICI